MKAKLYPNKELRNRLVELGIPRRKHNLAELGEMLPDTVTTKKWGLSFMCENFEREKSIDDVNEANARAKMLVYLLENKTIKKKIGGKE